jgi:tetratricopeptide (TPR) repeat protein
MTIDGFTAALRTLGDGETARHYSREAAASPGLGVEASAGVRLASADILLPSAPDEALGIVTDVRRTAPPEPFAGEANLLMAKYAASRSDWNRALDILGALEGSRVDDIGARAAIEKGRTLESMGRTADAVDEYLKVAYLFPDLGDRAAEGMANAARVSRARGDIDRAAKIEQTLRKSYPVSPWIEPR